MKKYVWPQKKTTAHPRNNFRPKAKTALRPEFLAESGRTATRNSKTTTWGEPVLTAEPVRLARVRL